MPGRFLIETGTFFHPLPERQRGKCFLSPSLTFKPCWFAIRFCYAENCLPQITNQHPQMSCLQKISLLREKGSPEIILV